MTTLYSPKLSPEKKLRQLIAAEARRERIVKKREKHLERMLLPNAPPRKRPSRIKSPLRDPCIMVADLPIKPEVGRRKSTPGEPSTSRTSCNIKQEKNIRDDAEASTSDLSQGAVEENVLDLDYELVKEEILCDSDNDDLNTDSDPLFLTTQERDAAYEPACNSDLTKFQVKVLRREDVANDKALRDIWPDDCYTFNWSRDRNTFLGRRETFSGKSGPTFKLTNQTRPIDVFDKMFDVDFIDLLCTETNRHAEQKIASLRSQNKLPKNSRFHRWCPTDRDEMVSFLAVLILQGLYPLPEEESYFSFNGFGTMSYFNKIMNYNRFLLLKSFFHFVDNETVQDTSKLCKIRPIIDYFNAKFSSLYMPSQNIAVDESLLKWYGRLNFTQKILSKAAQVGIKTYELCESSTGYLWKFFVYTGKDKPPATLDSTDERKDVPEDDDTAVDDSSDDDRPDNDRPGDNRPENDPTVNNIGRPSSTAKIVYELIEPLLYRGHTLIMDNFYNSPLLLRSLKRRGTDCFGTLRLNREFVPDSIKSLTKAELRKGEVVATYCSDLAVLVWRDANLVSMISTYHNLQIGVQDKFNRVTHKPNIVLDYNKSMGGIVKKDQFLSAQPLERERNKIWYKTLFRRVYNAALFNCYVIFASFNQKLEHRKFRVTLAEELLKRHRQIDLTNEHRLTNVRSNTTGKVMATTVRRCTSIKTQARPNLEHNHFPIRTGSKYTRCFVCPKSSRTIWKCEECNINLCIDGCFKAYHKPRIVP